MEKLSDSYSVSLLDEVQSYITGNSWLILMHCTEYAKPEIWTLNSPSTTAQNFCIWEDLEARVWENNLTDIERFTDVIAKGKESCP